MHFIRFLASITLQPKSVSVAKISTMKYVSIALSTIRYILALYQNIVNTMLHPELMANRFFRNHFFTQSSTENMEYIGGSVRFMRSKQ